MRSNANQQGSSVRTTDHGTSNFIYINEMKYKYQFFIILIIYGLIFDNFGCIPQRWGHDTTNHDTTNHDTTDHDTTNHDTTNHNTTLTH